MRPSLVLLLPILIATHAKKAAREVLEKLYEAAGGIKWRNRKNWLQGSPCRWHGIECDRGQITSIDLGGNGVRGTLPMQLSSLSALKVLNIDESYLSGTIPANVAPSLETLLMASNGVLSGTLPPLGAALHVLDVSRTRISGTLPSAALGALSRLEKLQLDHTRLSGSLPTQIGKLTRAQSVFVHGSPLLSGTLPSELGRLTTLTLGSSFASTRLSGTLPTTLGALTKLRALWITHTHISGSVPTQMGCLAALRQLELHASDLTGRLPSELGKLRLGACVLTSAQGPHQPRHSMRPVDGARPDSNRFKCPLPKGLPAPCVPHLRCTVGANASVSGGAVGAAPLRAFRRLGRGAMRGARRMRAVGTL